MLTTQQIFNKIVARLEDGTGRAFHGSSSTTCTYRNKKGHECVVGIFLPDVKEIYDYSAGVDDMVDQFKYHPEFPQEITENVEMLLDLQQIHDGGHNWNGKEFTGQAALEVVAQRYGLKYN